MGCGKPVTASSSWKKIFPDNEEYICLGFDEAIKSIPASTIFLMHTNSCENVNAENSEQWLEIDYDHWL
jgi:hypothetical protein